MAISAEWIINKGKKKIYAISHAKAVVRGSSTVDADLALIESGMKSLDQKIEDKKAGLIEMKYEDWQKYSETQKAALGDVLVTDYPMSFTFGDMQSAVLTLQNAQDSAKANLELLNGEVIPHTYNNAGVHNSIYRGKYLGDSVTAAQYKAISDGTFKDLFIGDYWTIGGVNWRIAAFNYWINCGDTACTTNHVVLVPDTGLYNAQMNTTNTTTGGYMGSAMYKSNLATAKTTINNAFGSAHVLSHREYLTNAMSNGYPSAGAWVDSTVELMNERMLYGAGCFNPANNGSTVPNLYTIDKTQLPLFKFRPDLIGIRNSFWLRDVITAASFARVGNGGYADCSDASNSFVVRPAFAIKA